MNLTFTSDEYLTFQNGPSYVLLLFFAMSIMYFFLIFFWLFLNGWKVCSRAYCKLNHSLTFLFVLKWILELMALFIFGWIEMNGFLFFGVELYNIVTLLFDGIFYGILVLVSRGWCITKESTQLSPFDRQIGFISSFGMTLSEMVSEGYNRIVSVSTIPYFKNLIVMRISYISYLFKDIAGIYRKIRIGIEIRNC